MQILITVLMFGAICVSCALAEEVSFAVDSSQWYAFTPQNTPDDGLLGLSTWNDHIAGERGRLEMQNDRLVLAGTPIKLWGLNSEYADTAPPKEVSEFRAAFFAKYGFNSIRLHKFNDGPGWAGFGSLLSTVKFDPQALDRFDYYCAQLKKRGLYINLSSNFGVKVGPDDADRFEAFEDFFDAEKGWNPNHPRLHIGHGSIYLSPGLQAIHAEQLTNLLNHKNPYTGLTYAEDPAIGFVEIFNEDSALFYTTIGKIQHSPIMRQYISKKFAQWLEVKYGSEQQWRQAWGPACIIHSLDDIENGHLRSLAGPKKINGTVPPESFANGVVPLGQPWFYDAVSRPTGDPEMKALRRRLLDTAEFFTDVQDQFNSQMVNAIRQTGYPGIIIGSNWQAGSMAGHYWNLMSDRKVGIIDRHNYFGGGGRSLHLQDGQNVNTASQLDRPGSELISSALQQVVDRPFMFSEWNVVQPTEWYVEGPAIIGAYGMGLQGWDASYIFASYQQRGFASHLDAVKKFSIDTPPILGVMPAIARMVRRGDIRQAPETALLHVSQAQLQQGNLDFDSFTTQSHDLKSFDGDKVPTEAIAAVRTAVAFHSQPQATDAVNLEEYRENNGIRAATGQLFWSDNEGEHANYFTADSPGTKVVVGFLDDGQRFECGDVTVVSEPGFAALIVTATGQDEDLRTSSTALIVAMARARNTGMTFSDDGRTLITVGKGPIRLEPVSARITFERSVAEVTLLDHDGKPTNRRAKLLDDHTVQINGVVDKTPYYRVRLR